jgi:hypothetical protein
MLAISLLATLGIPVAGLSGGMLPSPRDLTASRAAVYLAMVTGQTDCNLCTTKAANSQYPSMFFRCSVLQASRAAKVALDKWWVRIVSPPLSAQMLSMLRKAGEVVVEKPLRPFPLLGQAHPMGRRYEASKS